MALPKNPSERQRDNVISELERNINNKGLVTLKAGSPTTVVNDPRVYSTNDIDLIPKTADANTAKANAWVSSVEDGRFVITHSELPNTNRKFAFLIV